jgi:predicted AAA+ superfamily ATPase
MEIIRQEYIDKLLRYSKIKDIKIITGLRRSGKTTVLKQFISFIKTNNIATEENILTYDFNNRLLLDKLT